MFVWEGQGYTAGRMIRLPAFFPDSRGNSLAKFEISRVTETGERRLYLCGPDEVADQIRMFATCKPMRLSLDKSREWTHRLGFPGPVPERVKSVLELFKEVLVLRVGPPIDAAIALDFYKDPKSHEDPMQWSNTYAGSLIHQGKYYGNTEAFEELATRLADVIERHPTYAAADYVLSIPGHDQTRSSFGERLARRVAELTGKPLVAAKAVHLQRPAAKARQAGDPALADEFEVPDEVAGRVVIAVDDVWGHGDTMGAISAKAKAAGVAGFLGLVGARRMRS
jgi:hypothetical protein